MVALGKHQLDYLMDFKEICHIKSFDELCFLSLPFSVYSELGCIMVQLLYSLTKYYWLSSHLLGRIEALSKFRLLLYKICSLTFPLPLVTVSDFNQMHLDSSVNMLLILNKLT